MFILSAIALASGIVCILIRNITHSDLFTFIGGGFFLCGIILLIVYWVLSSKHKNAPGSEDDMSEYEQMLSEIRDAMYGDDDEGKPEISVTSPLLGKFIYRRKPEWYEAICDWCGNEINVTFEADGKRAPEELLAVIEFLYANREQLDRRIRRMAADELERLKAKAECPDELRSVKTKDFAKRLVPSSLHLAENGEAYPLEICFFDVPLRSECTVIAYGNADGEIIRAEICKNI